jgi:hypothetical protein
MMAGLMLLLRAMHASGAERLLTLHNTYTAWLRPTVSENAPEGFERTDTPAKHAEGCELAEGPWLEGPRKDSEEHAGGYELADGPGRKVPPKDSEKNAGGYELAEGTQAELLEELVALEATHATAGEACSGEAAAGEVPGSSPAEAQSTGGFEEWLEVVQRRGTQPHAIMQTSAHQVHSGRKLKSLLRYCTVLE